MKVGFIVDAHHIEFSSLAQVILGLKIGDWVTMHNDGQCIRFEKSKKAGMGYELKMRSKRSTIARINKLEIVEVLREKFNEHHDKRFFIPTGQDFVIVFKGTVVTVLPEKKNKNPEPPKREEQKQGRNG